jgi:hypothetical protein
MTVMAKEDSGEYETTAGTKGDDRGSTSIGIKTMLEAVMEGLGCETRALGAQTTCVGAGRGDV